MTRRDFAVSEHQKGYNCAQSVALAFADDIDVSRETIINLAGGLGGGVRCGEVCGAVSGAVMVIGAKRGFTLETKGALNQVVIAFTDKFRAKHGAVACRDLLGYDFSKPGQNAEAVRSGRTKEVCPGLIAGAVEILEEMLAAGDLL